MRPALSALLAAALLAAPTQAQDEKYYGLADAGRLALNGTVLDKLPGSYDPEDSTDPNADEAWIDLVVVGSDRYALRADGLVRKNGGKLFKLPYTPFDPFWSAMTVVGETVYAVRRDGLVMRDKKVFAQYPETVFPFVDIEVALDGRVLALATDGAVFVDDQEDVVALDLRGDPPVPGPLGGDDGNSPFTIWLDIEVADNGDVYGLRTDGILTRGDDVTANGETVVANVWAVFPGPTPSLPNPAFAYSDFELQDGVAPTPIALRRDGQIHSAPALLEDPLLLVDHAGDGLDLDQIFTDLAIDDAGELEAWALRSDGRLYGNFEAGPQILNFPKKGYLRVAVSDAAPDLTNFKNSNPVVGRYKVRVLEGQALSIPIVLTDSDKPVDELIVSLFDDPEELDPGVTWDGDEWRMELDDSLTKGAVKLRIEVDDGEAKKPKKYKLSAKVVPLDKNLEKNKPPKLIKVKPLQALVGIPFEIELLAFDPDGDEVTFAADLGKKKNNIFTLDETDAVIVVEEGRTIVRWTPQFDDIGKQLLRVTLTDGDKTKKGALKIKVVSPLIF